MKINIKAKPFLGFQSWKNKLFQCKKIESPDNVLHLLKENYFEVH